VGRGAGGKGRRWVGQGVDAWDQARTFCAAACAGACARLLGCKHVGREHLGMGANSRCGLVGPGVDSLRAQSCGSE
jgi:hypothetical protein